MEFDAQLSAVKKKAEIKEGNSGARKEESFEDHDFYNASYAAFGISFPGVCMFAFAFLQRANHLRNGQIFHS